MNGDTTGLESADPSSAEHLVRRARDALGLFNQTAKAACDLAEHKLQREAEDAAGRLVGFIETLEGQIALQQRRLDGEDQENAQKIDGSAS